MSLRYPVPANELINYTDDQGRSCWTDPDPWPAILNERRLEAMNRITPEMVAECKAMIERAKEKRNIVAVAEVKAN